MNEPEVEILYEEGPTLIAAKRAGLLTQAPRGIASLETALKEQLKRRDAKTGNIYLAVAHRLDRPVSGPVVFNRHVRAARRVSDQFSRREVRKIYWAMVEGEVTPGAGTWVDTLRKIPGRAQVEVVDSAHPEGREAVLHYRVLATTAEGTWLEVQLETGRTHQIRVQCAHRGWPVLGDEQYGATTAFGPAVDDPRDRAIALHGRELALAHPMTRAAIAVTVPVPPLWRTLDLPLEE